MNITEELDKIIDKHKVDVSYVGRLESFKIEILELFERKLNEVVPDVITCENELVGYCKFESCKFESDCAECRKIKNIVITDIRQNKKKVLEGK